VTSLSCLKVDDSDVGRKKSQAIEIDRSLRRAVVSPPPPATLTHQSGIPTTTSSCSPYAPPPSATMTNGFVLSCAHNFCADCLRLYLRDAIVDGHVWNIECPFVGAAYDCDHVLSDAEISAALDERTRAEFVAAKAVRDNPHTSVAFSRWGDAAGSVPAVRTSLSTTRGVRRRCCATVRGAATCTASSTRTDTRGRAAKRTTGGTCRRSGATLTPSTRSTAASATDTSSSRTGSGASERRRGGGLR
jgi:hypothetical protein